MPPRLRCPTIRIRDHEKYCNDIHSLVAILCRHSKPDQCFGSITVNAAHGIDLMVLFGVVVLISASLINPERRTNTLFPGSQEPVQIFPDLHRLTIDYDIRSWCGRAPCVCERFVEWFGGKVDNLHIPIYLVQRRGYRSQYLGLMTRAVKVEWLIAKSTSRLVCNCCYIRVVGCVNGRTRMSWLC
jgi:hypothetical protein